MGFAKYAEDNEEIMLERISSRPYYWWDSVSLDVYTDPANRKQKSNIHEGRKKPLPC